MRSKVEDWVKQLNKDLAVIFSGVSDINKSEISEFAKTLAPFIKDEKLANYIHGCAEGKGFGTIDNFIITVVIIISNIINGPDRLGSVVRKPLADAASANLVPAINLLMETKLAKKIDPTGDLINNVISHLRHWIDNFKIVMHSGVENMPRTRLAILESVLNLHFIRIGRFRESARVEGRDLLCFFMYDLDGLMHYLGQDRFENGQTVEAVFLLIKRLGQQMGPGEFKAAVVALGRKQIYIKVLEIFYELLKQ